MRDKEPGSNVSICRAAAAFDHRTAVRQALAELLQSAGPRVQADRSGPPLAARRSKEGLLTAIIERHHSGGTCVNTGCVPTKALVAIARAMHQARRGDVFGFSTTAFQVVMAQRAKTRKDTIVVKPRERVEKWMNRAGVRGGLFAYASNATRPVGHGISIPHSRRSRRTAFGRPRDPATPAQRTSNPAACQP